MIRPAATAALALGLGAVLGCGAAKRYLTPFEVRQIYAERLGPNHGLEVPFLINDQVRGFYAERVRGSNPSDLIQSILSVTFRDKNGLGLTYNNDSTLTANETFTAGQGNCLSFVNLFVGISRAFSVRAEFVEVEDYDTFRRDGAFVVNGTHIVGGLAHGGRIYTVDFVPGRSKRYRRFHTISDLHAVAHFYNNRAVELMLAGELEQARAQLGQVVKLTPDFSKAWNNLGVCLNRLGQRSQAINAFEHALKADPGFVLPHENLAALYIRAGEVSLARAEIEAARRLRSRNPFFLLMQADRALAEERYAEAQQLYEKARQRDRSLADVYVGLGRIAIASGETKEAEKQLRKALQLEADHPTALELLRGLLEASPNSKPPSASVGSNSSLASKP